MSDASDRTIPATPRRRQAAVDAGMLPTASAIAAFVSLAATFACLPSWCRLVCDSAVESLRSVLRSPTDAGLADAAQPTLVIAASTGAVVLVSLAATLAIRLILEPVRFRPSRCLPDPRRLNPVRGTARLLSWATVTRLVWSCLAAAMLVAVGAWSVGPVGLDLGRTIGADPLTTAVPAWGSLWPVLAAAVGIAAVEWAFARLRFERRIRMTPQEYQDELRSLEADPKIKLQRHEARRASHRAA